MDKLKYYIGTGLKFDVIDPKFETGEYELSSIDLLGYESLTGINVMQQSAELFHFEDVQFKMRPLSSLTKEITVGDYNDGKPFVPIIELAKILFDDIKWQDGGFELVEDNKVYFHSYESVNHFWYDFELELFMVDLNGEECICGTFTEMKQIIEFLCKCHIWIGDQSEFGKSLIEIKE